MVVLHKRLGSNKILGLKKGFGTSAIVHKSGIGILLSVAMAKQHTTPRPMSISTPIKVRPGCSASIGQHSKAAFQQQTPLSIPVIAIRPTNVP